MNPAALEWIQKAEGDFASAVREQRARKQPNFDAACYHAQQCIEKYLKARLTEAGIPFPRTHDLEALLDLTLPLEPLWNALRGQVITLTSYAVEFRYPGATATREMAATAVRDARSVRSQLRSDMGLPS